ncbi:CAAX amino terminal protease self-immunity [Pseudoruegeria aquimaris]|uniref:CAAX amino terminal protease self-immunity n=1 Tax=Pseudoruegeria aquimaris TaxID=393663 RepID=A0A1Y5SKW4_9RHOB|nr:CPBP family intramembrane glutamic endopeptidase [Pseudoruegeria aquimaris]SLN43135.1 CAAX amino terminal protease self-immunity [Pseudoruegeria aquimaris]
MSMTADNRRHVPGMLRLKAEFLAFFVLGPVAIAVFMPPDLLFPMLFLIMVLGLLLLHVTPGFQWRRLKESWGGVAWRYVWGMGLLTALVSYLVMRLLAPEQLFGLFDRVPWYFFLILIPGYTLLSALPQEIVFRVLFFRRYREILPKGRAALYLNGAIFSLAHLMYWSVTVCVLTFFAGVLFAWAYKEKHSLGLAVAMHAVAGCVLFLFGMGAFFYSGNVVRPF